MSYCHSSESCQLQVDCNSPWTMTVCHSAHLCVQHQDVICYKCRTVDFVYFQLLNIFSFAVITMHACTVVRLSLSFNRFVLKFWCRAFFMIVGIIFSVAFTTCEIE